VSEPVDAALPDHMDSPSKKPRLDSE
jgi:hypothetical protein